MDRSSAPRHETIVTVVTAEACHFCDDAQTELADLAEEYPLRVEVVDARTPQGTRLVRVYRSTMYPLVLVDGEFFSVGRLPRKKLRHLLGSRVPAETS